MKARLVSGYAGGEARPADVPDLPADLGTWSWMLTQMTGNIVRKDLCVDCQQEAPIAGRRVCKACHNRRSLEYYYANRKTTVAERKKQCA